MIKKIAILGSTGSIGKTLLKVLEKDKKNIKIYFLTANKNYKELIKQAKKFNVKNLIIKDKKSYLFLKKKFQNKNIKIYNNYDCFKKIIKKKLDYVMSSIVGLEGLKPTFEIIRFTKKIAVANKESLICAWNLINKELKKNNTEFIPVDSEHFSIWFGIRNIKNNVEKIIITASGGPFLNLPLSKFKNINRSQALNHPNWKMGNKITIDSATMMNKVFEIIEAKNIFNFKYNQLSILTHPKSYIHAIIKFENGLIKIIAHDTDMKIPIINSVYSNQYNLNIKSNNIDIKRLNEVSFSKVNLKKFPLIKILNSMPRKNSLFETILISANDEFVSQFLSNKISFLDINKKILQIIRNRKFNKYKRITPKNINDIIKLHEYVRLKIKSKRI